MKIKTSKQLGCAKYAEKQMSQAAKVLWKLRRKFGNALSNYDAAMQVYNALHDTPWSEQGKTDFRTPQDVVTIMKWERGRLVAGFSANKQEGEQ